jgi:hypothetical protein
MCIESNFSERTKQMSRIGQRISSVIPHSGLVSERSRRWEENQGFAVTNEIEEVRKSFDTDGDGRSDTLLVQYKENGNLSSSSVYRMENGSIDDEHLIGRGRSLETMSAGANGRIHSHSAELTDGRVGYRYHRDENADGFVDYSELHTGVIHPDGSRIMLDYVKLKDSDADGSFDKKTVSARYLMFDGGRREAYSHEGRDAGGGLYNVSETEDVELPLDTLPEKGEKEELVMGSLLDHLLGR